MMRISLLLLWMLVSWPCAAGIIASATRVIFHEGEAQQSLMLVNTNPWPVVVQIWVDDGDINREPGSVKTPFVAVPPLFRLEPKGVQGLRIMHNKARMPTDRESAFWLNIYEIPPTGSVATQQQSMVLTMNTQMKIFWRPASLNNPESAWARLTFHREGSVLVCHNDSPYFVTFAGINFKAGEKLYPVTQLPDMMVAPFGEKRYAFAANAPFSGQVQGELIDDNGNSAVYNWPVK
ncbi:TPA: molecular chaperone [Enterobacter hormaechei]|nr:molecular chaperone [Enterobacter hormaechei]